MPTKPTTQDVVDALSNRRTLINSLAEEPKDKRELHAALDVSRSTVDRGIRELETLGLVIYTSGKLTLTGSGWQLVQRYKKFESTITAILEAQSILSVLDRNSEIDTAVLADADIVTTDTVAPYTPGEKLTEMIHEADRCRMFSRAHTYRGSADVFYDEIVNGQMDTETVFEKQMHNHLQNAYPDMLRESVKCENFTGYVAETVPFGLYLLEWQETTHIVLLVYGSDNQYGGIITNDSEKAIEWGERTYERYVDQADRIEL